MIKRYAMLEKCFHELGVDFTRNEKKTIVVCCFHQSALKPSWKFVIEGNKVVYIVNTQMRNW